MKLADWAPSPNDSLRTISVLQTTIQVLQEVIEIVEDSSDGSVWGKIANIEFIVNDALNTEVGP